MTRSDDSYRSGSNALLGSSILGRGWAFPIAFDESGEAKLVPDFDDVDQSIQVILGTAPGERLMRPDFGAGLNRLVFEPMTTTTLELVKTRVTEALLRWEPRITVQEVVVASASSAGSLGANSSRSGLLLITIRYLIRASNTERSLVYPFYLQEGVGG